MHGYDTMLALHLDSLSISSSINAETFLKAKSCKVGRVTSLSELTPACYHDADSSSVGCATRLGV